MIHRPSTSMIPTAVGIDVLLNVTALDNLLQSIGGASLISRTEFRSALLNPRALEYLLSASQLKNLVRCLRSYLPRNNSHLRTQQGRKAVLAQRIVDAIKFAIPTALRAGAPPAPAPLPPPPTPPTPTATPTAASIAAAAAARARSAEQSTLAGLTFLQRQQLQQQQQLQQLQRYQQFHSLQEQQRLNDLMHGDGYSPLHAPNHRPYQPPLPARPPPPPVKRIPAFGEVQQASEYLRGRSPFYTLMDAVAHKEVSSSVRVNIRFELPQSKVDLIRRAKTHTLHLRLFSTDTMTHVPFDNTWEIMVNMRRAVVEQKTKKVGFKKTAAHVVAPLDLSAFVQLNTNNVNASYSPGLDKPFRGFFVMEYVHLETVTSLSSRVLARSAPAAAVKAASTTTTSARPSVPLPSPPPPPPLLLPKCGFCGVRGAELRRCSQCKKQWYCGAGHQEQHWSVHKLVCVPGSTPPPPPPPPRPIVGPSSLILPPRVATTTTAAVNTGGGGGGGGNNNDGGDDDDDDDIAVVESVISLMGPISLERMATPCKGRRCKHPQCFDLATFLENCGHTNVWQCPVCHKATEFDELVLDRQMWEILRRTGKNVTQVKLNVNGTFEEMKDDDNGGDDDDDDDDDDSDDDMPGGGGGKKRFAERAVLDGADDVHAQQRPVVPSYADAARGHASPSPSSSSHAAAAAGSGRGGFMPSSNSSGSAWPPPPPSRPNKRARLHRISGRSGDGDRSSSSSSTAHRPTNTYGNFSNNPNHNANNSSRSSSVDRNRNARRPSSTTSSAAFEGTSLHNPIVLD